MRTGSEKLEEKILSLLRSAGGRGISQGSIGIKLGVSKSYLSDKLSEMENRSLIYREKGPGRTKRIWETLSHPGMSSKLIRIGLLRSSEYIPLMNTMRKVASRRKIRLVFRPTDSARELMSLLNEKTIEAAFAPLYTSTMSALTSGDLKIIHLIGSGGGAIFQRKGYDGNDCLTTEISSMTIMLKSYMSRNNSNFTLDSFTNPCKGLKAFEAGKHGRICIWEPYATCLRKLGTMEEIGSYRDILGELPCCCVVTTLDSASRVSQLIDGKFDGEIEWSGYEEIDFCGCSGSVRESLSSYNFNVDRSFVAFLEYIGRLGITVSENTASEIYAPATS
ncbi:MAG: hypothetical protein M1148_03845 [Candidatus Thermoplasmatota archaeon]|nr:hypothetical protein [Candidatus Thermoplasmatota archaeon]MCL5438311.1 hypothetical protein [Candidatus Thermoplasmatota archaeon]